MFLLANSFALGSLAGGFLVSLISCYLVHDAESWLLLVWAGYSVVGCVQAVIYGPVLKILAFGRTEVSRQDARRAFITSAVCAVGAYLFTVLAQTHQYDRVLLFTIPLCAALLDTARARAGHRAINEESSEISPSVGD